MSNKDDVIDLTLKSWKLNIALKLIQTLFHSYNDKCESKFHQIAILFTTND